MITQKQKFKEEHEKSHFFQSIWGEDGWLDTTRRRDSSDNIFKKVDKEVVLDNEFNTADIAIYLAILKLSSFTKNYRAKISSTQIQEVSGIARQNQSRSIKKLQSKGIIHVLGGRYENSYKMTKEAEKWLPLKLRQFDGLAYDRKSYVRRLRAILLSNGNGKVPEYQNSKKKMGGKLTREEHRNMKAIYNAYSTDEDKDFDQYLKLALVN